MKEKQWYVNIIFCNIIYFSNISWCNYFTYVQSEKCIKHNYTSTMTRKKNPCHRSLFNGILEFMKCQFSWNDKMIISMNRKYFFSRLLREYLTAISNSQDTMAAAASLLQETQICNTHGMKLLSRPFPWRNGLIPL